MGAGKGSGVIAFPITPFKSDLSLDVEGLQENLAKLLAHPICAVVAAGGTGEMYSLTPAEHLEVIQTTVAATQGRVPVIAGVGFNQQLATETARAAADSGADGILALPPYYPNADDEGMLAYYRAIGDATPLGLFIYSRDWANFTPAMVEHLTSSPNLIAWKDGHGVIRRYQAIINRVGDRLHWIGGAGDDCVPAYYSIGIRTYTSSIATVAPKLSLELHEVAAAGKSEELIKLMNECVIPLYAFRTRKKGYEVSVMKEMMHLVGLAAGPVRPPLAPVRIEEIAELKEMLRRWQPFLTKSRELVAR